MPQSLQFIAKTLRSFEHDAVWESRCGSNGMRDYMPGFNDEQKHEGAYQSNCGWAA